LISLRGPIGWTLFGFIWAIGLLGVVLNLINMERFKKLSMIGYIAGGWCVILAIVPLTQVMAWQGILLLVLGGVFYTMGTLFYRQKAIQYMHMIWHLFVLVAAICHFFCILLYVL
jgi:hemolysin III